jgi:AraC family transcriptional regulator
MEHSGSSLLEVLSRTDSYQLAKVSRLAGKCRGTLINCSFEAHTLESPPLKEMVLLGANEYQLKSALFDFGWGYRNHFTSHPHPLHIFPPNVPFRWVKDGSANVTLLTLESDTLTRLFGELGVDNVQEGLWELSQRGFSGPLIYLALTNFLQQSSAQSPQLLVDSYCTVIASELALRWKTRLHQGPATRRLSAPVLARVVAHMKEHLADDLSLDELAAVGGVTKYHFLRCFKASTGSSPVQYLTELRITRAKQLLGSTRLPMDQVAQQCGFGQAGNLARAFGKASGVTPRAYRAAYGVGRSTSAPDH